MKKSVFPFTAFAVISVSLLLSAVVHAQPGSTLTFEQVFKNAEPGITRPLPNISGWADDRHYLELKKKEGDDRPRLYIVDAETGTDSVYHDLKPYADVCPAGLVPDSPLSSSTDFTRHIYSFHNDLYALDTRTRSCRRLTQSAAQERNPALSPDGKHVAFTRDNDLFSIDLVSDVETRYTTDGSETILNGWASWVYYEEILGRASRYRAFWWAPDSKTIAFYRFDDGQVPVFPLFNAEGPHGSLEHTHYPKPGDPNPAVRIGTVRTGTTSVTWAAFNEKDDQYFGPPFWTPDGNQLLIQWMNRAQDTLTLYGLDPRTGTLRTLYREHQKSWVDWHESVTFVGKGEGFVLRSDRGGWSHLYLHSMDGRLRGRLTSGNWNVTGLLAVDTTAQIAYFTARKEASTRTDLYRVRLDGTGFRRLTAGDDTHTISMSPAQSFFVTTFSNVARPPRMSIHRSDGSLVRELGDAMTEDFGRFLLGKTEMLTIPTPDGLALPAYWMLPVNFDPSRTYPVLISVYGGPNAGSVFDGWKGISNQWLALEGVIQIAVDHRGSGHFGKKGVALMHRRLGYWEMHDYGTAARWLRALPYVDSSRICITGSSYGGYVTCMALTAGSDYFTHGIAELAVTDWHLYDSHYTERFMDTPAENPAGYKEGSVLTHAHKYKGMLAIVHGTMDDNVHMQNAVQLVDTLQDLNKHFETMFYPGGRHGWGGQKALHLRLETYRFYYYYLLRKEFPEDLFKTLDASSMRRRR
jgi:dipeptidyl-peptidase-4